MQCRSPILQTYIYPSIHLQLALVSISQHICCKTKLSYLESLVDTENRIKHNNNKMSLCEHCTIATVWEGNVVSRPLAAVFNPRSIRRNITDRLPPTTTRFFSIRRVR